MAVTRRARGSGFGGLAELGLLGCTMPNPALPNQNPDYPTYPEPLSATTLDWAGALAHVQDDPALSGTGFEGHASSDWLRVVGPVTPLEPVELTTFVADLGDGVRASVVLLDNFRWHCGGCEPETCGLGL